MDTDPLNLPARGCLIGGHGTQTGFLYGKAYNVNLTVGAALRRSRGRGVGGSVAVRASRRRPYPGSLADPSGLRCL